MGYKTADMKSDNRERANDFFDLEMIGCRSDRGMETDTKRAYD